MHANRITKGLTIGILLAAAAAADVPRRISFQGKLAGQDAGPVNLTVTIYDAAVGGAALFSETHLAVPLSSGVFSIEIGSETAGGVPDSALATWPLWLGVSVDGGAELTPRTLLGSVPFAIKSYSGERLVRPDTLEPVAGTGADTGLAFEPGSWPLITAGHDNASGHETRMWIGHSESYPTWGIQYRDFPSAGYPGDAIEFVAGDPNRPRLNFRLFTGTLSLYDGSGSTQTNSIQLDTSSSGGVVRAANTSGDTTIVLDGDRSGGGIVEVSNAAGTTTVELDGQGGSSGGDVQLRNGTGTRTARLYGDESNAGGAYFYYSDGTTTGIELDVVGNSSEAEISLYNSSGVETVQISADESSDGGDIALRNAAGTQTCQLDADYAGTGESRLRVDVVQILGGADLSEQFDVRAADASEIKPGMVVSIDPAHVGKLVISRKAYDRTVAGILSGAGAVKPGLLMGQRDSLADGAHAVALTGRVWVYCDASHGAIQPGDLLTTSDVPGHAMKVREHDKAQGAILGKAMSSLESGRGLVLVLVSLQ